MRPNTYDSGFLEQAYFDIPVWTVPLFVTATVVLVGVSSVFFVIRGAAEWIEKTLSYLKNKEKTMDKQTNPDIPTNPQALILIEPEGTHATKLHMVGRYDIKAANVFELVDRMWAQYVRALQISGVVSEPGEKERFYNAIFALRGPEFLVYPFVYKCIADISPATPLLYGDWTPEILRHIKTSHQAAVIEVIQEGVPRSDFQHLVDHKVYRETEVPVDQIKTLFRRIMPKLVK